MNNLCPFSLYCFLSFFCVGVITSFDDVVGLEVGWYCWLVGIFRSVCVVVGALFVRLSFIV